jgi:hypothetical protein
MGRMSQFLFRVAFRTRARVLHARRIGVTVVHAWPRLRHCLKLSSAGSAPLRLNAAEVAPAPRPYARVLAEEKQRSFAELNRAERAGNSAGSGNDAACAMMTLNAPRAQLAGAPRKPQAESDSAGEPLASVWDRGPLALPGPLAMARILRARLDPGGPGPLTPPARAGRLAAGTGTRRLLRPWAGPGAGRCAPDLRKPTGSRQRRRGLGARSSLGDAAGDGLPPRARRAACQWQVPRSRSHLT